MNVFTITLRLCTAVLLGGLIGMERENKRRAAGLRTHILVSLGSALVMVVSECMFNEFRGLTNIDPGRLGAQVISGIGFLGAGTIIKQGFSIKGLTTAASLWTVACIGIAAGMGYYTAAGMATVIVYVTLFLLHKFEKVLIGKPLTDIKLSIRLKNTPERLGDMIAFIGMTGARVKNISFCNEENDSFATTFTLHIPKSKNSEEIIRGLKAIEGAKIL